MAVSQRGHVGKRKGKQGVSWHAIMSPPRHPVSCEKRKQKWIGTYLLRRDAVEALNHALAQLDAEDKALKRGEVVDITIMLSKWIDEWLKLWIRRARPKRGTIRNVRGQCRKIKAALGQHRLAELRRAHIQDFVDQCLEFDFGRDGGPISPNTVGYHLSRLKQILQSAVEEGKLRESPAASVKPPPRVPYVVELITREMLEQILEAAATHAWLLAVIYMDVQTGLRSSELCGLQWNKWDRNMRTILIDSALRYDGESYTETPKSESGRRTIPHGPDLTAFLEGHQKLQKEFYAGLGRPWSDQVYIFCNSLGRPLTAYQIWRAYKKVVISLGYPKLRFHDLRHAFGSYLAENNVHVKTSMKLMGHANESQTLAYTHVSDQMKREAMENLGRDFA